MWSRDKNVGHTLLLIFLIGDNIMEIARLLTMRKNLYVELSAAAEDLSRKNEYLILKGKVELLDEIIAEELNGVKSIDIDSSQFDNEKITYKLYDTLGLQLECDFPNMNISFEQASRIAFDWMEDLNIAETTIACYRNGLLIAKKILIVHK